MIIKVNEKKIDIPEGTPTINDLLKTMGINRETVVVALNGEISIEETGLSEGDEVKLISAVSGG
jgi:thiamine biosynthesis protein ThiS